MPAVKGTINVLSSAAKVKTVKRVALTSSNAAVSYSEAGLNPQSPNAVVDESWWSDEEWCKKNEMWYALSKTQAEVAAWDFVKDQDFDLVVLIPNLVLGPILQTTMNASSEMLLQFLNEYQNRMIGVVHVKDVAMGHVLAYEDPSAEGRYFLAERGLHMAEIMTILRGLCPTCPIPERCADSKERFRLKYSNEKAQKLGLVFTPAEEAMKECIASLKERELLKC